MTKTLIQVVLGACGVVTALLIIAWVLQLGPFHKGPSAAARVEAKVEKAVPKVQGQAAAAVAKVEGETRTAIVNTDRKADRHVANIRAAQRAPAAPGAPRLVYRDFPDGQFYGGVCESKFYAGGADCRGLGRQPEGGGPRPGAGALRGR